MRAVVCRRYGPPEDLVLDEVADPTPGPGNWWFECAQRQ